MRTEPYVLPAALAAEARTLLGVSEAVIRALHARARKRPLAGEDLEQLAAMLTGGGAEQLIARLDAAEQEMRAHLLAQEASR